MNQIFDQIWYTLKFLVFLYFLECGYIYVLVYCKNFHKIMYCDVIRHVHKSADSWRRSGYQLKKHEQKKKKNEKKRKEKKNEKKTVRKGTKKSKQTRRKKGKKTARKETKQKKKKKNVKKRNEMKRT